MERFNQPIDKDVLPQSLKSITISVHDFNQPIGKDVLPQSLKELHFGYDFNQPIGKDVLPQSLRRITISVIILINLLKKMYCLNH